LFEVTMQTDKIQIMLKGMLYCSLYLFVGLAGSLGETNQAPNFADKEIAEETKALKKMYPDYKQAYDMYHDYSQASHQEKGEAMLVLLAGNGNSFALNELVTIYKSNSNYVELEKWWPLLFEKYFDKEGNSTAIAEASLMLSNQHAPKGLRQRAYKYLLEYADKGNDEAIISILSFFDINEMLQEIGVRKLEVDDSYPTTERLIKSLIITNPKEGYFWYGKLKSKNGLDTNYIEAFVYFKQSVSLGKTDGIKEIVSLVSSNRGTVNTLSEELFWRYMLRATSSGIATGFTARINNEEINNIEKSMRVSGKDIEAIKEAASKALTELRAKINIKCSGTR